MLITKVLPFLLLTFNHNAASAIISPRTLFAEGLAPLKCAINLGAFKWWGPEANTLLVKPVEKALHNNQDEGCGKRIDDREASKGDNHDKAMKL
ncbi:hypothetical protein QVD17_37586 [Tagetes erecta]|uniref:Uncharacterized protein n=1 Tax=Tagetes erecta TaxID=13708 RepID=A0AAD8JYJ2_TARER|nr:hypothetical protein QVD17_37586 [Tagetes erecta]